MRSWAFLFVIILSGSFLFAQANNADFGPSAAWQLPPDFTPAVKTACESAAIDCVVQQMQKAGAPADAIRFTRQLHADNGHIGIIGSIKAFGPVSYAWIQYPFRAEAPDGLMFLNSKPRFIDPDDLPKLDRTAMQQDTVFQQWKKTAPKLDLSPPDRVPGPEQIQGARVYAGDTPGVQRFLFSYPLSEGCAGCPRRGVANYWWDFDAKGKFLGAHFLSVTRGMPPKKRARPTAPGPSGAVPPTPPSSPPATPQQQ